MRLDTFSLDRHGEGGCFSHAIAGFIPALLTGGAPSGMESAEGNLLGTLPINAVHNVVHVAIGAALLYGATATPAAIQVSRVPAGRHRHPAAPGNRRRAVRRLHGRPD